MIYVLPAAGWDVTAPPPHRPLPLTFHALSQVLGSVAATNVAAARSPVHVLSSPSTQTISLGAIRVSARVLLIFAGLSSIGIAASPEPIVGSTPQHLAWTSFGAVIITVWPAFTTRPGSPQPLILSRRGSAIVTTVFLALLSWLMIETQGGSDLGMAERLTSSVQTSWPFVVAVVLWRHAVRTRRPVALPDR